MCWRRASLARWGRAGGSPPALLGLAAAAMAAATDGAPMMEGRLDSLESRGAWAVMVRSSRGRLLPADGEPLPATEGPPYDAVVTDIGTA
jgi:hypothetical protein